MITLIPPADGPLVGEIAMTVGPVWLKKTVAAPMPLSFSGAPMSAVVPSAESATDVPWLGRPTVPAPTSFNPCWAQTPPLRVQTHAAPVARG